MYRESTSSQRATETIDVHLSFSSLQIENVQRQSYSSSQTLYQEEEENDRRIKLYRLNSLFPFVSFRQLVVGLRDWRSWARGVSLLFRLYIVIKLSCLAAIHFKFDETRLKLWPQSRIGPKCIDSSITRDSTDLIRRHNQLEDWLHSLGTVVIIYSGLTSTGYSIGASLIVCFDFIGPAVIRFKKPGLSIYGFIKNKRAERRKFVDSLRALIDDLFVCHDQVNQIDGRNVYRYTPKGGLFKLKKRNREPLILHRKELHELLEPAHLTDGWHQKLCLGFCRLTRVGFVIFFGFGSIMQILVVVIEAVQRHKYRLDTLDCLKLNETLSPQYSSPIRLAKLERDWQFEAYNRYDGSLESSIKLTLVELKLAIGFREISTFMDIIHALVFGSFTVSLYVAIYAAQYGSKILWLNQITLQVKQCVASLIETLKTNGTREESGQTKRTNHHNHNIRLLTVAYLNYELFRREQKAYQSLANLLVTQMTLLYVPSLISTYFALGVLRDDGKMLTFVILSYVLAFLNMYLITSAIRTSMALKLMKEISRLVAYISENNLAQSLVGKLWSSQVLNHSETLDCFAPKLLGISLSFDRIVTLNAYLLVLSILALDV